MLCIRYMKICLNDIAKFYKMSYYNIAIWTITILNCRAIR